MYIMGIDPTTGQTSAQGPAFRVGSMGAVVEAPSLYTAPMSSSGSTAGTFEGPKVFVYVSAGAGITAGQALQLSADSVATPTVASTAVGGRRLAVATCDIESGGYGWVQVFGKVDLVNVLSGALAGGGVSTSATSGALDDAVAGVTLRPVTGITLDSVDGTAAVAHLNWPSIGAVFTS